MFERGCSEIPPIALPFVFEDADLDGDRVQGILLNLNGVALPSADVLIT